MNKLTQELLAHVLELPFPSLFVGSSQLVCFALTRKHVALPKRSDN